MSTSKTLAAPVAHATDLPPPIITRIDDRFVSIRRGSTFEVVFRPIRPGISLFGSAPPPIVNVLPPRKPAVTSPPPSSTPPVKTPVSTSTPVLTPVLTPAPVINKPASNANPVVVPAVIPVVVPVVVPAVSPTPLTSKPTGNVAVTTNTPSLTAGPTVKTPASNPPVTTGTAASTPSPAAPPPVVVDLVAQANAARYQEAFHAPAPFGDEAPKSGNGKTTPVRTHLSLDEDTQDLALGKSLDGIGNALDNRLTGNDQNNILDGMGGADTMIGGKGDDSYYVDQSGDKIVEQADEGVDTVYASVSTTLSANVENLVLLDGTRAQRAVVKGVKVLVYGLPRSYQLDYDQGNGVSGFSGTCGETSVANVTLMAGQPASEKDVVLRAIQEHLCDITSASADRRGGTNEFDRQALLQDFGLAATISDGFDAQSVAQGIKDGKGVLISVSAGQLWGMDLGDDEISDHVVTVTGVACAADSDKIVGFYIADSGRGMASDMCRFVTTQQLQDATDVRGADTIITDDSIKLRNQDLDASGNELDNILVGNRGNNLITGGKGNDLLIGNAGNDSYVFAKGDGQDVVYDHDATRDNLDTLTFSDAKQTNLWFSKAGSDLRIDVLGSTDQVLVKDWYVGGASGSDNHVERIKTADGKTLHDTDVDKLVQAMASFAPPAATQTSWPTTQGGNGKVLLTISH